MRRLFVLMTTYNGEKYLRCQLDSILAQDCEEKNLARLKILIRDDGSSDSTPDILREYEKRCPDTVQWIAGKNIGVTGGVFTLLRKACMADYYALADQDDYWPKDKMSAAIRQLEEAGGGGKLPCLYCCRPKLADADLRPLSTRFDRQKMQPSFGNALIENVVTGCTAVCNEALRALVVRELPRYAIMHDRWLYLIASCFGKVIVDDKAHILYRQHEENVVGMEKNWLKEGKNRLHDFAEKRNDIYRQTAEFVRIFGDLTAREDLMRCGESKQVKDNISLAKLLVLGKHSLKDRIRLLRTGKCHRQRTTDGVIFQILILLGLY